MKNCVKIQIFHKMAKIAPLIFSLKIRIFEKLTKMQKFYSFILAQKFKYKKSPQILFVYLRRKNSNISKMTKKRKLYLFMFGAKIQTFQKMAEIYFLQENSKSIKKWRKSKYFQFEN